MDTVYVSFAIDVASKPILKISLDSIECLHTIEDNLLVLLMTSRWR
jgi:hypothetical protein